MSYQIQDLILIPLPLLIPHNKTHYLRYPFLFWHIVLITNPRPQSFVFCAFIKILLPLPFITFSSVFVRFISHICEVYVLLQFNCDNNVEEYVYICLLIYQLNAEIIKALKK